MASPFSRTLRSLRSEQSAGWLVGLAVLAFLFAAWSAWFVAARLPIYALSEDARLEVELDVYPVAALAGGRVVEVRAEVGSEVETGDVLFELDSELERRRLDEETARYQSLLREIESLRVALVTERQGLGDSDSVTRAAIEEARARYQAELAAAEAADEKARRSAQLHEQGLTSDQELNDVQSAARERRSQAEALRFTVERLRSDGRRESRDRQVRIDQIERELAELEGSAETSAATVRRLEEEIARRLIRSPASGRLGEVAKVRAGSVVAAGDRLATVVPDSGLKVVANFPPSDALARVRAGQRARLRLDGFPWTEFGSLEATVSRVSTEARDGRLRVDCAVTPSADSAIPLQHGMPGTLVVEIERVSPAELALRAAGRAVSARSGNGSREDG